MRCRKVRERKSSYWELYTPLGAWEVNFLNLNILIVEKLILTDISVLLILSWASVSWEPISFSLWCPILTFSFSSCSLNKLRLQIVTLICQSISMSCWFMPILFINHSCTQSKNDEKKNINGILIFIHFTFDERPRGTFLSNWWIWSILHSMTELTKAIGKEVHFFTIEDFYPF